MRMQTKFGTIAALVMVAAMFTASAPAQVLNSGASPIALNAVLPDSITLTLSGNAVNFTLVGGSASNPGSTSITATTTWLLRPNVNSLKLYAFFSSSTAALSDGAGHNIPSADFQISDNGGGFEPSRILCPLAEPTQDSKYRLYGFWEITRRARIVTL